MVEVIPEISLSDPAGAGVRREALSAAKRPPERAPSALKPLLIGVAVGAALTTSVLLVRSRGRFGEPRRLVAPGSRIGGVLVKAALWRLARIAARRAVRAAASKAVNRLAASWS